MSDTEKTCTLGGAGGKSRLSNTEYVEKEPERSECDAWALPFVLNYSLAVSLSTLTAVCDRLYGSSSSLGRVARPNRLIDTHFNGVSTARNKSTPLCTRPLSARINARATKKTMGGKEW